MYMQKLLHSSSTSRSFIALYMSVVDQKYTMQRKCADFFYKFQIPILKAHW